MKRREFFRHLGYVTALPLVLVGCVRRLPQPEPEEEYYDGPLDDADFEWSSGKCIVVTDRTEVQQESVRKMVALLEERSNPDFIRQLKNNVMSHNPLIERLKDGPTR